MRGERVAHGSREGALWHRRVVAAALIVAALSIAPAPPLDAEPVAVSYAEGVTHGFLRLRTLQGTPLAEGEMLQRRRGPRVTSRLMFRFRDGSRYDESTVFLQQRQFRLVSDHLVQRGPSFPQTMDMSIDAMSGNVVVKYTDKGEQKMESEHLDLPEDVANGMLQTLLKNVRADSPPKSFPYVAATPKPRLVKLNVSVAGHDRFAIGRIGHMATHYVLKVDIGGVTGVLASVLGKVPPDSHVWILHDDAPAFLRAEQPFFNGGPLWRIELAAPEWTGSTAR